MELCLAAAPASPLAVISSLCTLHRVTLYDSASELSKIDGFSVRFAISVIISTVDTAFLKKLLWRVWLPVASSLTRTGIRKAVSWVTAWIGVRLTADQNAQIWDLHVDVSVESKPSCKCVICAILISLNSVEEDLCGAFLFVNFIFLQVMIHSVSRALVSFS